mgnify:FL=1
MYLFVAGTMFAFTACGGGETATEETVETTTEEVVETTTEEVAEAVGCQVEGGTCLEDHSCCAPAVDATEEVVEEGHDHGAEGHSHE